VSPFKNTAYFDIVYGQANIVEGGLGSTEFMFSYFSPREKNFSYSIHKWRYKDSSIEDDLWRVETNYSLRNGNGLNLAVELTDYTLGARTRKEQKVELGMTFGTWLNISFTQEKLPRRTLPARQWWNLLEVKVQRAGKDVLSIVYGKRREGFVCSGGICRLEPAFDGWKVFYTKFF